MNVSIYFVLILFITGCHNYTNSSTEKYQQLILGDWNETYTEKMQVIAKGDIFMRNPYELFRYTFSANDSLEYHLGFFKGHYEYFGNFAAYRIKHDSLFIKNPATEMWDKIKLLHISDESMVWRYASGEISLFEKFQNEETYNIRVDSVILSYSSYCLNNTCLDYLLQVNANGKIKYNGVRAMDKMGYYQGKIPTSQIHYLFNKFTRFDVSRLSKFYKEPGLYSEGALVQAAIYYDDTVKNVTVYDGYYPAGLAHALIPLHILYRTVSLTKVDPLKAKQWFDGYHVLTLDDVL